MTNTDFIEKSLGRWVRKRLPKPCAEFVLFGLKQGWACLFGGLLLIALICTKAIWNDTWPVARYDALLLFALFTQALMLLFKLETFEEAKVIALFHLTGTALEIFKVSVGSWSYPEAAVFKIMDVPLFSGFMYASVGSYMARVIRIFQMRFTPYPPYWVSLIFGAAIYVNFYSHHFIADIRVALFLASLALFWRTRIYFQVGETYWMPLPVAAFSSSFFLWLAENIGTLTGTWVYAGSADFDWASLSKMGSWYLLLYVCFATVTCVIRSPLDITENRAKPECKSPQRSRPIG